MTDILRSYHKGWKDKTSEGFTRRVRWFEGDVDGSMSIRLCFEERDPSDRNGKRVRVNRFYSSRKEAQVDYERFAVEGEQARTFRNEDEETPYVSGGLPGAPPGPIGADVGHVQPDTRGTNRPRRRRL